MIKKIKSLSVGILLSLIAAEIISAQEIDNVVGPKSPATFKNRVGLTYDFDVYNRQYNSKHFSALEYLRKTKYGSLIGRINMMNRAGQNGFQYELDLYPRLGKRSYGYLNAGYSEASVFPKYRLGLELFNVFKNNIEASLGYRYINFSSSSVSIITGTIGLYTGNYWFSFRAYLTPKENALSNSYNLTGRKYFKDGDNYLSLVLGYGSFYDENRAGGNYNVSYNIGLTNQMSLTKKLILATRVEYRLEELSFSPGEYVNHYVLSCGFKYKF